MPLSCAAADGRVLPGILGVLDWELSALGHPLADLAWQTNWLTMPDAYNEDGSLPAGIPTEEEFVQMYAENRGWARVEPDEWDFFRGKSLAWPRGRAFALVF